jgi:hypothetical protein
VRPSRSPWRRTCPVPDDRRSARPPRAPRRRGAVMRDEEQGASFANEGMGVGGAGRSGSGRPAVTIHRERYPTPGPRIGSLSIAVTVLLCIGAQCASVNTVVSAAEELDRAKNLGIRCGLPAAAHLSGASGVENSKRVNRTRPGRVRSASRAVAPGTGGHPRNRRSPQEQAAARTAVEERQRAVAMRNDRPREGTTTRTTIRPAPGGRRSPAARG